MVRSVHFRGKELRIHTALLKAFEGKGVKKYEMTDAFVFSEDLQLSAAAVEM